MDLDWLYNLENHKWELGLLPIQELLKKLGNPEKNLNCVHVAGTNGKGSVCAMLSSVLSQKYKVGMYTSPHLKRFNERLQINGKEISDERLSLLIEQIKPHHTNQSFFEVTTALAFLYFFEENVDLVLLEVGLGGRLDATNVIIPLVSVITSISKDHENYLGDTIEKISFEKAGIIKENIPVVTSASKEALTVIKKIAKEKHASLVVPKPFKGSLNLYGSFQKENASLALATLELLKDFPVSDEEIKQGLMTIYWPKRFEFIEKNVIVDSAHNPAALKSLHKELVHLPYGKIITIAGMLSDKNTQEMVDTLTLFSDYIIFSKPDTPRAEDPKTLQKLTTLRTEVISDVKKALKKAKKLVNPEDLIVITGSIYLVAAL